MTPRTCLSVLWCLGVFNMCSCYNIDVLHARVLKGPKGSLFGYTSVITQSGGEYKLIVGAPKDNNGILNETGATYTCHINSLECTREYKIRNPQHPEVSRSGIYYSDREMYGSFITKTVNNSLLVCAPRFKDLSSGSDIPSMIGQCIMNGRDFLRPLFKPSQEDYFRNVSVNGQWTEVFWNSMGQTGLSGDSMKKLYGQTVHLLRLTTVALRSFGNRAADIPNFKFKPLDGTVILGVPGFMNWRGGVVLLSGIFYDTEQYMTSSKIPEFSYIGYSVVVGNFCGKRKLCFAAGGPGKMSGRVLIYQYKPNRTKKLKLHQTLEGDQPWSYFGASLCSADVNGDGFDDLLVGSPFYTDESDDRDNRKKICVDEGRVTVFINDHQAKRKPNFVKSSVLLRGSNEHKSRFGTAISNIGDVNKDGCEDVAIGAPYEDDGRGVVYIYHGSKGGLSPEVKQRILGRDVNSDVTSFGWSISKPADMDGNTYPDFAVGSYLSDRVVILRTRPIVSVMVTMETDPELIVRNKYLCPPGFDTEECFTVTLCFRYAGPGLPSKLEFNYTATADTYVATDYKRVLFNSTQGLADTLSATVVVRRGAPICQTLQAITIKSQKVRDPFTVVRLEASYQLRQPADPRSEIQPVSSQEQSATVTKDIAFQLACGEDNQCWSDLVVEAKSRTTNEIDDIIKPELKNTIVINSTQTVVVDVLVTNYGEDAFATVAYVTWTGSVEMQTIESPPDQPIVCEEGKVELDELTSKRQCDFLFPILANATSEFQIYFDVNDLESDQFVNITFSLETRNNETSPTDNKDSLSVPVWIDANIYITGISASEQIFVRMDEPDNFLVELAYMYVIRNTGPCALPPTDVIVELPYFLPNGKRLVESAAITLLLEDNRSVTCHPVTDGSPRDNIRSYLPREMTPRKERHSASYVTSTTQVTTASDNTRKSAKLDDGSQNGGGRNIIMDCDLYGCKKFACTVQQLPPEGRAVVRVAAKIPLRQLTMDKVSFFLLITTSC